MFSFSVETPKKEEQKKSFPIHWNRFWDCAYKASCVVKSYGKTSPKTSPKRQSNQNFWWIPSFLSPRFQQQHLAIGIFWEAICQVRPSTTSTHDNHVIDLPQWCFWDRQEGLQTWRQPGAASEDGGDEGWWDDDEGWDPIWPNVRTQGRFLTLKAPGSPGHSKILAKTGLHTQFYEGST